jgi:glycine oxidase
VLGGLPRAGGSVDPRRLVRALDLAVRRAGVEVRCGVEVRGVRTAGQAIVGVDTSDGPLEADLVVIAAGAWSNTLDGCEPRPPVHPQRGQILAVDHSALGLRHVLLTPTDPYFVPRPDGRLVIGATREEAGWDGSLTVDGVAWLLNSAMAVVPGVRDCPIVELWTGFRPLSDDGLPLIGPGGLRGLWYLTGHGPSGIAPLPGSLALLGALVTGQAPPVDPMPFSPTRFRGT